MMISREQVTAAAISGQRRETAAGYSGSVRGAVSRFSSGGMATSGSFFSHLKLLTYAGAINRTAAGDAIIAFDEVRAMTWRLLNPRS